MSDGESTIIIIIFVVVAIVFLVMFAIALYALIETFVRSKTTITIEYKTAEGKNQYKVYDTNGHVYAIQNGIMYGVFRASELFGKLEVGNTYTVHLIGKRVPWLNLFPKITQVHGA